MFFVLLGLLGSIWAVWYIFYLVELWFGKHSSDA
jgi:hypothetical protein